MASPQQSKPTQKYACTLCSRRKVKCDRLEPCSNCTKSKVQCLYQSPTPPQRQRKRVADSELLSKISRYEELLRKNNVEFDSNDSVYLPPASPFEEKLQQSTPASTPATASFVLDKETPQSLNPSKSLWTTLSPELQNPPIKRLPPTEQELKDSLEETPGTNNILLNTSSWSGNSLDLHPEPRHIFRLWQIFLENVNPLTKIIHAPTLQQRIFEISWNLQNIPKPLEALMFAIYTLAVASLSSTQCKELFGEGKAVLYHRFRLGSTQSLVAAELVTTNDLEVLQAFVLFLLAEPESESTATLTAVALRIGQKMGFHRPNPPNISLFENEMRIRLWWQIRGMEARIARCRHNLPRLPLAEIGEGRMPLNINDSDLHPDMVTLPVEHTGATEMIYCLLKYEVSNYLRTFSNVGLLFAPNSQTQPQAPISVKDEAFDGLEKVYKEKYLQYCDRNIPLHALALDVSRMALARMRVMAHDPRKRADLGAGMTAQEIGSLFENCLTVLELDSKCRKSKFSQQLLGHMITKSQIDALVFVLSELRRCVEGEVVDRAWKIVQEIYEEHRVLVENNENSFYVALGDLVVEAWGSRHRHLFNVQMGDRMDDITPGFIKTLDSTRQRSNEMAPPPIGGLTGPMFNEMPMVGFEGDPLDWSYWNEFLQV